MNAQVQPGTNDGSKNARMKRPSAFLSTALGLFVAVVALAVDAQPQAPAPKAPPSASPGPVVPFEKYALDNGLTVLLHRDPSLPIVAVEVWYRVGPVNEPPGRSG